MERSKCLAPSFHEGLPLILNRIGAYAFTMYAARTCKFADGSAVAMYNRRGRFAVVGHLEWLYLPLQVSGVSFRQIIWTITLNAVLVICHRYFWSVLSSFKLTFGKSAIILTKCVTGNCSRVDKRLLSGPENAHWPAVVPSRLCSKCRRWSSSPWSMQISHCSGFLSYCSNSVITPPTLPVFTLVLSHPTASNFSVDMWSSLRCSTVLDFKHSAEPTLGETWPKVRRVLFAD